MGDVQNNRNDDFMWQEDEKYVAGEFVWTGCDYLGEPTPYGNDQTRAHGLTISLAGPGTITGIGNGNPQSKEPFTGNKVKLFYGKAMVIIGAGLEKGDLSVTVTSNGITKASTKISIH